MNIHLYSIHGLIRGNAIEMGRDADTGGQSRYVVELARHLARKPEIHNVLLFTRAIHDPAVGSDYARPVEKLADRAQIVRIPCGPEKYIRKEKLWPWLPEFARNAVAFARQHSLCPDIVHGHYVDAGVVAAEVAKIFDVPFVFTGHSLGKPKREMLLTGGMTREAANEKFAIDFRIEQEEFVLGEADLVIASTRDERDRQYGEYASAPPQATLRVIAPGTNCQVFHPFCRSDQAKPGPVEPGSMESGPIESGAVEPASNGQATTEHNDGFPGNELDRFLLDRTKPMILSVCRPARRKNLQGLVELYGESQILQDLANLVIIAGNREDVRELPANERQVMTDVLLLMDRYDLYGKMAIPKHHHPEQDIPELYRLAASTGGVFVNPAHFELFGLTAIESAATGLPFVATQVGGPADIAKRTGAGIVVDVSVARDFERAVAGLLIDNDRWNRLSTAGIVNVRKYFSWERHVDEYLDAITPLIEPGEIGEPGKVGESDDTSRDGQSVGSPDARHQPVVKRKRHVPGDAAAADCRFPSDHPTGPGGFPGMASAADRVKRVLCLRKNWLVADLDGTGPEDNAALSRLRDVMLAGAGRLGFAVATGRSPQLIEETLGHTGLPELLDVVIASAGTEIYYGRDRFQDHLWSQKLAAGWRPAEIAERLEKLDWLAPRDQETTPRKFKVSFILTGEFTGQVAARKISASLGELAGSCNVVVSRDRRVAVLPVSADHGAAIRYICQRFQVPVSRVITAGDPNSDREMIDGPFRSILFGNFDSGLSDFAARPRPNRYVAKSPQAAGILEGLQHFGIIDPRRPAAPVDCALHLASVARTAEEVPAGESDSGSNPVSGEPKYVRAGSGVILVDPVENLHLSGSRVPTQVFTETSRVALPGPQRERATGNSGSGKRYPLQGGSDLNSPLRIAIIGHLKHPISEPFAGGLEKFTWQLVKRLEAEGHLVTLFASGDSDPSLPLEAALAKGSLALAKDHAGTDRTGCIERLEDESFERTMRKVASGNFDVVHNNSLHPTPLIWSDHLNCPMITTLHVPPLPRLASVLRRMKPGRAGTFVSISRANADRWRELVESHHIIPNGVDLAALPFGPECGSRRAAWIGRILPDKGTHLAIEASHRAGLPIEIAGPVGDPDYFHNEVRPRLGTYDRYHGLVGPDRVSELLKKSAVTLVTPCWDEPFGLVVAESLASGTPVAGFARGALPELVTEQVGALVKREDPGQLAMAIAKCLRLARLDCREHAERCFPIETMIEQYISYYRLASVGAFHA